MSSEGSVSSNGSRIRQFGLYRSIDARTEEFLRLSRRRQIRQGCACAAVSTAITVTVVVVVIFIYEFSLNSEVNLEASLKSNWFSLINDTTENGFKTKYSKSGIDKTTLTLLPMLLKALKKNVFLEKILEEQPSSVPPYEEKDTTEYSFEKNVFTRNWFRIPSSKLYAIAYKTFPLSYYKSSTKNLEHFTKIRKIRDYQRIMNYMDKMISEKVYIRSTKPMVKEETNTEKLLTTKVPKAIKIITEAKPEFQSKPPIPKTLVSNKTNAENNNTINCKCPIKFSVLLHKILFMFEKLLSINTSSEMNNMTDCHHKNAYKLNNKILGEKPASLSFKDNEVVTIKIVDTTSKEDSDNIIKIIALDQNRSNTKITKPILQSNYKPNNNDKTFEISTSLLNNHLDVTDEIPKITTKPMTSINKSENNNRLDQKSSFNIFSQKGQERDRYKNDIRLLYENNYNDRVTATNVIDSLFNFSELEAMNNKIIEAEKLRQDTFDSKNTKAFHFKPASYKKNLNFSQFVEARTHNNLVKNLSKAIYQMIERNNNIKIKPMPTETTTIVPTTKLTTKRLLKNSTLIKKEAKKNRNNTLSNIVDEEIENQNDLTQEDNILNPIESSQDFLAETNDSGTKLVWEELKNEDIPAWKSMIPNHRPVYLEIHQKNDWKHEEQDYDFNIINTYDNIPDLVILLIYEYAIAVEWSLVQRIKSGNGTYVVKNITHDTPFADRLDRSFFGFDQDYYERMPLLVNALQESNYIDPVIEMSRPLNRKPHGRNITSPRTFSPNANRQTKIRKSSPRPFIFEYRSATPLPFSKTYGSRSWVDSYRNAQRLQNIRQVIRYLEKTINAKAGDMHTKPTNGHTIAFSGVYVEPKVERDKPDESNSMEQQQQNSNRVETYANHNEDPLFNFKPDSPGEVNLLADTYLRFAPVPTPSLVEDTKPNKVPMFRRIPYRKHCLGSQCNTNTQEKINNIKSSTEHITELPTSTKSFSVMLNLYPLKPNASPEYKRQDDKTKLSTEKIYITTSKPLIQFRRKPAPMRRTYYRYKKPRYLTRNRNFIDTRSTVHKTEPPIRSENNSTTMIVHVDVYSPEDKNGLRNQTLIQYTTSSIRPSTILPILEKPELFAGQVEDHHDGSSGLITIQIPDITEAATSTTSPTVIPFFDPTSTSTEANPWATATSPPDVLKFSAEDAKVPDHYINMGTTEAIPFNLDRYNMNWETTQIAPLEMESLNLATTQMEMERKYINWVTTQNMPTEDYEMDRMINWETTQAPMDMGRRSMNLVTTRAVPMETVRMNLDWTTTQAPTEIDSRDMRFETTLPPTNAERGNMKWATTQAPTEMDRYGHSINKPKNKLKDTLIIKLRNDITTTERGNPTTTEEVEETTTAQTYVPQINGHYRSIVATRDQNRYSPEAYRKRKLEMSVTGFRSYVPIYTEIRRNTTRNTNL